MNEDEPFLARWSRLKRTQADPETAQSEPAAEAAKTAADDHPPEPAPSTSAAEAELDLSSLPRLEDITAQTDIRAFLDPRVPSSLQNEALRRAWRLDPVIDSFIEVADYQWDWNTPGGMPGYGPLEPGTDVAMLLAHAIGKLVAVVTQPDKPDSVDARPAEVESADSEQSAISDPPAATATAPEIAFADQVETRAPPDPDQNASQSAGLAPQRRHGSALPR